MNGQDAITLPIDVLPRTDPPMFRWKQLITSPIGTSVVEQEGSLPVTCEAAVVALITLTKRLLKENAMLQGQVQGLCDRVAGQSELLSQRAEKPAPVPATPSQPVSSRKSRG